MRKIVLVLAVLLGITAIVAIVVALWLASDIGLGQFAVPSDAKVRRDVERFYASGDERRPRGELRGCFSRHAGLWFYCEFDHPSAGAAARITCVEVNVDEPCCSWESGRWRAADLVRARTEAAAGRSICG